MGGLGSGGWNATGRLTTADVPCINVNRLARGAALQGYSCGTIRWRLQGIDEHAEFVALGDRISLSFGKVPARCTEEIAISWENCRFGGRRPFFRCPGCGERTLHLYRLRHFRCRTCHGLSYGSQRERESDRAQRRANRIRRSLGGEPGWHNFSPKPRGMHRRTYLRLMTEIMKADAITDKRARDLFGSLVM